MKLLRIKYHLKKEIQEIETLKNKNEILENQIKDLQIQNNRIIVLFGVILSILIINLLI